MKITKQDFASIVLVFVFLLSFGQTFAEDNGWPASYGADYGGIGVPGFTPEYIPNPFVTLPNGQTYAHNPLQYATLGTANTVAAMIGGVVGQSNWVGGPSTPSYGIATPGGTYIGNAGGIATTIANNDPLTALRMLTAWGADVPTDSPLYLAAQAQLQNPNLANSGFTTPSQIPSLPASLYGDVRIPGGSGVLGTPVTVGNVPNTGGNALRTEAILDIPNSTVNNLAGPLSVYGVDRDEIFYNYVSKILTSIKELERMRDRAYAAF